MHARISHRLPLCTKTPSTLYTHVALTFTAGILFAWARVMFLSERSTAAELPLNASLTLPLPIAFCRAMQMALKLQRAEDKTQAYHRVSGSQACSLQLIASPKGVQAPPGLLAQHTPSATAAAAD